jgi:peptidyl-prolyl cis-trans isomerase C
MDDKLNLTLPDRRTGRGPGAVTAVMLVLSVVVLALACGALVLAARGRSGGPDAAGGGAAAQKDLALKLEQQGLREQAVRAWTEYLGQRGLTADEQARIWYRVGKIHQEAGQPEEALYCYYRSESRSALPELASEIGRRTQECLEQAGRSAALRHELAGRVTIGQGGARSDKVVAEIGPEKITAADLDRMIEEQVEDAAAAAARFASPEQVRERKEAMLKSLSEPAQRLQMLEQLVALELLYREARESKLAEDPEVSAFLRDLERNALAQKVLEAEAAAKVSITETDLRTYYDAHSDEYMAPERAHISHILVAGEAAAEDVLGRLRAGEDFAELASAESLDEATRESGGALDAWVTPGGYVPGIGYSVEADSAIFAAGVEDLVSRPIKSDKGYHVIRVREREPERRRPYEEVRERIRSELRMRKEQDVQEALLQRLKERWDVVIHRSEFSTGGAAEPEDDAGAPQ